MVEKKTKESDENYFCHIVIPTRNYEESKLFYEKVFGWTVQKQAGTASMDILPQSNKGPSAELNSEEDVVVPTIYTSDINAKLRRIEEFGGRKLKEKTLIGEDAKYGYFALFEDPHGSKMCFYSRK
jgi:predicted enzyme related to lactoylglutathione lyase